MPQTIEVITDSIRLPAAPGRQFIIADSADKSLALTVPPFSSDNGGMTIVKGAAANSVTVSPDGTDTWNGVTDSITLENWGDAIRIVPGETEYIMTVNRQSVR
jgi:hypothetical protein